MRALAIILSVLVVGGSAVAAPTAADIEVAARFTARLQQLYQEGMAVSMGLDDTETLIDSFNNGEIDGDGLARAYGPAMARSRGGIDGYRAQLADGLTVPEIGDPVREKSMQGFAAMVTGLAGRLQAQYAIVERLHRAALSGDEAGYRVASADSLALAAGMVLDENIALENATAALAESHPQHGLYRAVIGGNEAIAVALRILEANYRGVEFNAAAYALGVERGLQRAESGIRDGDAAAAALAASFANRPAATPADEYSKQFIAELVEAYRRAFEVERRIAVIEHDFLDFLQTVSSGAEPAEDENFAVMAVSFQADLELAIAERMEEQAVRIRMVQDYARTLQEMSQTNG